MCTRTDVSPLNSVDVVWIGHEKPHGGRDVYEWHAGRLQRRRRNDIEAHGACVEQKSSISIVTGSVHCFLIKHDWANLMF